MLGPDSIPVERWWRKAEVQSVHDGDTVTLWIDLGFDTWTKKPLRLYGVNAPELSTAEGKASFYYTRSWMQEEHLAHNGFMVQYRSWDKYAPRFDGILVCGQGHCLNDDLLAADMAKPYLP